MKRIIFILFCLIPLISFGQKQFIRNTVTGDTVYFYRGTDLLELAKDPTKLNKNNGTATGTLTTAALNVGGKDLSIDSIAYVDGKYALWDGVDTVSPHINVVDQVDISSIAVMQDSITKYVKYDFVIQEISGVSYATPLTGAYTASHDADLTVVLTNALGQLTGGGSVLIKRGTYDGMSTVVIPYDNITIEGEGKYLTKLKLKNSADAGASMGNLIYVNGKDGFTLKDVELDGNHTNQTVIGDGATVVGVNSYGVFAYDTVGYTNTNNLLIEDVYIHDFTADGLLWNFGDGCTVRNSMMINNGYGDVEFFAYTENGRIENNTVGHTGNYAITVDGKNTIIQGNLVLPMDGPHGSSPNHAGIAIEQYSSVPIPKNISVLDNTIVGGDVTVTGIQIVVAGKNIHIDGNTITGIHTTGAYGIGIWVLHDTNTVITNNKISYSDVAAPVPYYAGIWLHSSYHDDVSNNSVLDVGDWGLRLSDGSDNNYIYGNRIEVLNNYATCVALNSGSDNNILKNNILYNSDLRFDIVDSGTGNVKFDNYALYRGALLPNTVLTNVAITATSDGLTTGLIASGYQFLTVTSASANNILSLPTASASVIGTAIRGMVGANGFELRPIAAQATSVYINGVTTNVEAAIPANSSFEITLIDATHWILKAWTSLGAEITAIIPDAV
jgi:parallel beta-helix repeat protein